MGFFKTIGPPLGGLVRSALGLAFLAVGGLVLAYYEGTLEKALFHLGVSLGRLVPPLLLGVSLGLVLAFLIRRSLAVEAMLTPWLLFLQSLPWLLIIPAVNIVPYIGLDERIIFLLIVLILIVYLGSALGPRKQPDRRRAERVKQGFNLAFFALFVAELFSRTSGVGAEFRFYALYFTPIQLMVYAALALGIHGLTKAMALILNLLWPKLFQQPS